MSSLRLRALVIAATAIAASRTVSAEASWSPVGPYGGNVRIVAPAPGAPAIVYASAAINGDSTAAIFRSADGGKSWARIHTEAATSTGLAVDPASASTVYACFERSIFRTTDSGVTWQAVDVGVPNFFCESVLLTAGPPSAIYLGGASVVVKSADGGRSWVTNPVGPGVGLVISLTAAPDSGTLYAGSYSYNGSDTGGGGIFRSSDAGVTWTPLTNGIGRPTVGDIAISRSNPHVVWAATSQGFFRSQDGGDSWVRRLASGTTGAVAIDPFDPSTAFASTGVFPPGSLVTHDDGFSWSPDGIPRPAQTLEFGSGALLFAGTDVGIYRSEDRGRTWKLSVEGMDGFVVRPIAAPPSAPGSVFAIAGEREYRSLDRGTHWEPMPGFAGNPASAPPPVVQFVFDDSSPGTAYAATREASASSIYKTTDGGAVWSAIGPTPNVGSPLGNDVALAIDPTDPRILYLTASGFFLDAGASSTFKSTDAGASWSLLTSTPAMTSLAVDPISPSTIYGGASLQKPPGVFRSTDGGTTWTSLPGYGGGAVRQLTVAGGTPATVWATAALGLFRSRDGGTTWSAASYGIPAGFGVNTVLVDPRDPRILYAGTVGGVYRSKDRGDIWLPLGGLFRSVFSLAVDSETLTLYAGTDAGAYRLSLAEADAGACTPGPTSLCLNDNRFRAEVRWQTVDGTGSGQVFPLTTDAGAFWFFTANNLELVVKVVDGNAVNGHFWVFGGQLTDVDYTLTVTDTQSRTVWTHHNPQGTLASFADTAAFGP